MSYEVGLVIFLIILYLAGYNKWSLVALGVIGLYMIYACKRPTLSTTSGVISNISGGALGSNFLDNSEAGACNEPYKHVAFVSDDHVYDEHV